MTQRHAKNIEIGIQYPALTKLEIFVNGLYFSGSICEIGMIISAITTSLEA